MKKIGEEVTMAGKLETITVIEFRKSPGEVFDSVALGKTFVVTKRGKPIAVLSKPPGETLVMNVGRKGEISYTI